SVTRAIVYSGIEAQVNDGHFSRIVVNAIHDLTQSEFWIKTMAILHKNGLQNQHVTEVMDYIGHKVFVERVQVDIKHKKISNLLIDVQAWHREINQASEKRKLNRRLPDAGIEDQRIELLGSEYEITQIRKMLDLYEEGREMHHCVYTYAGRCMNRSSYIFSLRLVEDEEFRTPLITIELRGNQVVQAKGKYNRQPNDLEKNIIKLWADEKKLRVVA
ncbi:MAG: PcfJ domain-containing protein, partial [Flavobacteriia bacterium]